jgi:hypothetical protein
VALILCLFVFFIKYHSYFFKNLTQVVDCIEEIDKLIKMLQTFFICYFFKHFNYLLLFFKQKGEQRKSSALSQID